MVKFLILLDIFTIIVIIKDNRYLLEKEKPKLIFLTILIPLIGAFIALKRSGFSFLNLLYPINKFLNKKRNLSDKIYFQEGVDIIDDLS